MLFSSLVFLCCFLPVVCLLCFALPRKLHNFILLVASLCFYAWGEPKYVLIMLASILVNYYAGITITKYGEYKKTILVSAVILNLGTLGYFKYSNFFIENINKVFHASLPHLDIIMPIGISFFTFQAMSYVIDVYRGDAKVQTKLKSLALYISFFPQLIAGPIVKYHDFDKYIENRKICVDDIICGAERFIVGLAKKAILANTMGAVADNIYGTGVNDISMSIAWTGAIAYTLQIFFDFSGYSDMAIGLGRIFGFHFLENFNYPYISTSITEFWRRWHISLSTWFKEYLYIPLGGNRVSKMRIYINLFIVFLATGFWHGASWNFIVWGLWHGLFIILEKRFGYAKKGGTPKWLLHIYTILVFVIGWVFFRAENLSIALNYIGVMFGFIHNAKIPFLMEYYITRKEILFGILAILYSIPWTVPGWDSDVWYCVLMHKIIIICLFIISIVCIAASTYNPFIYFRF